MTNKFSILNGAKDFSSRIFQNYLVFISTFSGTTRIKNPWSCAPTFLDQYKLPDINFNEHCLRNNNISIPKRVINL